MDRFSSILGTGSALPSRCVTNDDLAPLINSSHDWIVERTGIHQRYYAAEGETNSLLASRAAKEALQAASLPASEIDAIVYATLTPDYAFPGNGVYLQTHLGLSDIPALDVRAQCSGFLYGLSVADAWIRVGMYEHVLLVGSEVHSTALDFSEAGRDVTALFGDGAGAVVLGRSDTAGVQNITLGSDGSGAGLLKCEAPGSARFPSLDLDAVKTGKHFATMQGRSVFRKAVERLTLELGKAIKRSDTAVSEIVFVPHQANQRIIEMVASRLKIPIEQFVCTIKDHGNTTAASIPIALHRASTEGLLVDGATVICCAFGSGLTWGTAEILF